MRVFEFFRLEIHMPFNHSRISRHFRAVVVSESALLVVGLLAAAAAAAAAIFDFVNSTQRHCSEAEVAARKYTTHVARCCPAG